MRVNQRKDGTATDIPKRKDGKLRDIITNLLADDYACTRVWEAWYYGTMTQADFVLLSETERVDEIMSAVHAWHATELAGLREKMPKKVPEGPVDNGDDAVNSIPWETGHNKALDQALEALDEVIEKYKTELS